MFLKIVIICLVISSQLEIALGTVEHELQLETGLQEAARTAQTNNVALTPSEWMRKTACKSAGDETSNPYLALWKSFWQECNTDVHAWRYKYSDELKWPFKHLVKDKTLDERLANIFYSISLINMFDMDIFTFDSNDPSEDAKHEIGVAGPEVDDERCALELSVMSELFDDMQRQLDQFRAADKVTLANLSLEEHHIRLARVLDSYGRYESGMLDGKLFLAGSHEQCFGSQLKAVQGGDDKIQMRYCWASMNFDRQLHRLLQDRKKFDHESSRQLLFVGVCLPKSCHSKCFHSKETKSIVQRFVNSQLKLPDTIYVRDAYELESVFCLVDSDSELGRIPTSGRLCLLFIGGWTLICIAVSVMNFQKRLENVANEVKGPKRDKKKETYKVRHSLKAKICDCLDLVQSWKDFTSKRQIDAQAVIDFDTLNPVKLVSCVFCIASHTALIVGSYSAGTGQIAAYVEASPLLISAILTSTVVDTFFVISGMLMTYATLKKMSQVYSSRESEAADADGRRSSMSAGSFIKNWLRVAMYRYSRIAPLYALFFWFRRDVVTHLGLGPMWDYGLNHRTGSGACSQEPWYTPFTFVTAFKPMSQLCYLPSWSISSDILFALVLTPLILLYHDHPNCATRLTISLMIASFLAAHDGFARAFPPSIRQFLELTLQGIVLLFSNLSQLYTWPLYRAPAFLIGLLAGYHLFKYEQARTKQSQPTNNHKWPAWLSGAATKLAFLYLALHIPLTRFAGEIKRHYPPYQRLLMIYLLNTDRVIWSMANAVLFLQMVTTWRHNALMQSFAAKKWRTLSKLTFSLIFVHWVAIILYTGSLPVLPVFSLWHISAAFSLILMISVAVGTFVHVTFENPLDKLFKQVLLC